MIFASLFLIFLSSYFLVSTLGSFLYFFAAALGLIILNIEILSLLKMISPVGIISLNFLTFFFMLLLWLKKKRVLLKINFQNILINTKKLLHCFKLDKTLAILCCGVLFLIFISFVLSAFLPINDPDALTYHSYHSLVWADKGYIFHFDTKDVRNIVMPVNSEIIYSWIFSLTGKDIGFGLLEFLSYIFGIYGIWVFLGRLRFCFRKRLWAICIFSSFAGVISQISSTQTDLLVGVLLLYSMIFFFDWINRVNRRKVIDGYFSSLCFGIALGVKSTAFIAGLPLLLLFFVYSYLKFKDKKEGIKRFLFFIGFLGINFVIFSGYNYVLNFIDYSNPLGSDISINRHGFFGGIKGFIANFIRYNIQMFDFAGFMWGIYLSGIMFKIQGSIFSFLHIANDTGVIMRMEGLNSSLSEQTIGFGITGFLVFIPSALFGIFRLIKSSIGKISDKFNISCFDCCFKRNIKERYLIIYSLGLLFYLCLIVLSFALGYMVYSIRFICAFVVICSPVLILSYFRKNNFYKGLVVLFACFYLFIASGHMAARPYWKLLNTYINTQDKEEFIQDIRCMKDDFYMRKRKSCNIDENMFKYIEKDKIVGIFPDEYIMMQLTKINAKKKNIIADELLFTRIDKYNLKKYDYIITPEQYQTITEFNKKDKESFDKYRNTRHCLYIANDNRNKLILNANELKTLYEIQCIVPKNFLEFNGFNMIKQVETRWKDPKTGETTVSSLRIWKNNKY